jgi:hypothetical protein
MSERASLRWRLAACATAGSIIKPFLHFNFGLADLTVNQSVALIRTQHRDTPLVRAEFGGDPRKKARAATGEGARRTGAGGEGDGGGCDAASPNQDAEKHVCKTKATTVQPRVCQTCAPNW